MTNKHATAINDRLWISAMNACLRSFRRIARNAASPAIRSGSSPPEYLLAIAAPRARPVTRLFLHVGRLPCRQNKYRVSKVNVATGHVGRNQHSVCEKIRTKGIESGGKCARHRAEQVTGPEECDEGADPAITIIEYAAPKQQAIRVIAAIEKTEPQRIFRRTLPVFT